MHHRSYPPVSYATVAVLIFVFVFCLVGYIANIDRFMNIQDDCTPMKTVRATGILIPPVGTLIGYTKFKECDGDAF